MKAIIISAFFSALLLTECAATSFSPIDSDYYSNSPENVSGESFGDEIKETLDKMPYYFRIVVTLYDIEGFSYKEISNMINIPVGTVMSRLNRGRSLLRQKLKR